MTLVKIKPGKIPPAYNVPVKRGPIPGERYFTFSLRYWREIDYFGIGNVDADWLCSLLSRLRDLCGVRISEFQADESLKSSIRYHAIDWDARGIKMSLDDLDWLPSTVRDNEAEFPLLQFHVSKALGRVHGYWDSEWCFQVVLIDPMHNLQPSKDVGYKIRATAMSECRYTSLKSSLDAAMAKPCQDAACQLRHAARSILDGRSTERLSIVAGLNENVAGELQKLREKRDISISEIIEHGIVFWEESLGD